MKKFEYKKWVTENKHGSLNEQNYPTPGVGYAGGIPCHACISASTEILLKKLNQPIDFLNQQY